MKKLVLALAGVMALAGCSSTDDRDAYAGLPIVTSPEGATVYVGRLRIGTTPVNVPDSAWERAGGRIGNIGILRVIAPGCRLKTAPVDLAKFQRDVQVGLNCDGEGEFEPSDLGFLSSRSFRQILAGEDQRVDEEGLNALRRDELHVLYAEGRLTDPEFRAALNRL